MKSCGLVVPIAVYNFGRSFVLRPGGRKCSFTSFAEANAFLKNEAVFG